MAFSVPKRTLELQEFVPELFDHLNKRSFGPTFVDSIEQTSDSCLMVAMEDGSLFSVECKRVR